MPAAAGSGAAEAAGWRRDSDEARRAEDLRLCVLWAEHQEL
jgi:hypothetical protein